MAKCGTCRHFIGAGDWCLCCERHPELYYKDSPACEDYAEGTTAAEIRAALTGNSKAAQNGLPKTVKP